MPDDKPGESIQQEAVQQVAPSEAVNPQVPPHAPTALPAQPISNKDVKDAVEAIDDRVKRAEWLMIGLTAGIVLLTLGLVIVGILQWNAMRGQLHEMQTGSTDTHDLAVAAGKQADAAKDLADQAKRQTEKTDALIEKATEQAEATNRLAQEARRAADIARDTFNAANRPYVGLDGIVLTHGRLDAKGDWVPIGPRTRDTTRVTFTISIRNFGTIPATNATADWEILFDGVKQNTGSKFADKGITQYPGQVMLLQSTIGSIDYVPIAITGKKRMDIEITVNYEWPGHQHSECRTNRYDFELDRFLNLGACVKK